MTTNGIHLNLPLELSNQPGPPQRAVCPCTRLRKLPPRFLTVFYPRVLTDILRIRYKRDIHKSFAIW